MLVAGIFIMNMICQLASISFDLNKEMMGVIFFSLSFLDFSTHSDCFRFHITRKLVCCLSACAGVKKQFVVIRL